MGLADEPGTFAEVALCTDQPAIAARFYETALGSAPDPGATLRVPDEGHA